MATTRLEVSEPIDLGIDEAVLGLERARRMLVRDVLGTPFRVSVRPLRKVGTRRGLQPAMLDIAFRGEGEAAAISGHAWVWFDEDAPDDARQAYIKVEWRAEDPGGRPPSWLRDTLEVCLRQAFASDRAAPVV